MPSNYTGSSIAVQSPSPAPGAAVAPVIAIPSDTTDDMNSASIAQGFKCLADFVDWLTTRGVYGNFGTGADGNVSPGNVTLTLTRGMAYNNLTLAGTTVRPSRFPIFVKDTLTIDASSSIQDLGNGGGTGTGGTRGSAGAALAAAALGGSTAGGQGGVTNDPSAGTNATNTLSTAGGLGGAGGWSTVAGGTATAPSANAGPAYRMQTFQTGHLLGGGSLVMLTGGAGGGGGNGAPSGPHSGGGGGGGGGVILICARKVVVSGAGPHITVKGGAGGNGDGALAGGGGGGSGGLILLLASEVSGSLVTDVSGGAPGTGDGTATAGGAGLFLPFYV